MAVVFCVVLVGSSVVLWVFGTADVVVVRFASELKFPAVGLTVVFCPCMLKIAAAISNSVESLAEVIC